MVVINIDGKSSWGILLKAVIQWGVTVYRCFTSRALPYFLLPFLLLRY